jgi:hypothetical protein
MMFLGIILICGAIGLYLWLEKRKFSRMSSGGVQQFESYLSLWKSRFLELAAKLLSATLFCIGVAVTVKAYVA